MDNLERKRVLVVEDEVFVALDMAATIEDANGTVVGPVATVRQALDLLEQDHVDAAILDVNLPDGDIEPIVDALSDQHTFMVIYTGGGLPESLARRYPELPVFHKPTPPSVLTHTLASALLHHTG
ncbi:response regulator receiver protein [Paramesorhizobium deserti]|uniref:Response regulator receiver protein n=1 Tax=Paramesorhizobium deserti TaxID=1494590 RepID=A0A135I279_9HYPH|nr:response regulator [Paramesorhizobium deserti]KXF79546.1 response regulator receiver protein [Paramesorhizobium deserti]